MKHVHPPARNARSHELHEQRVDILHLHPTPQNRAPLALAQIPNTTSLAMVHSILDDDLTNCPNAILAGFLRDWWEEAREMNAKSASG